MNKIRAAIADDEPLARRGISQLLAQHDDIAVVAEARNGREAIRVLRNVKPDLIFLDIQMPVVDGFQVIKAVGVKQMPAVIFVTAHDEFAVRAFEANALDYLVKPLQRKRFAEALQRMRERRKSAEAMDLSRKLSSLLAAQEKERLRQRIVVPTSCGELVIDSDEIDWIEADDYYAAIHARNGRHLVRESLTSLMQRLDPAHFIRVHRSAIVNISQVGEVRNADGDTKLVLRNGVKVPVSRRRRNITRRILRRLKE
jgi:two-component system, LytTR family, response regulator